MRNTGYWFKRRRYGYGWTPVTWQGWIVVAGYVSLALSWSVVSQWDLDGVGWWVAVLVYGAVMSVATMALVMINLAKGPSPKWRWGASPSDNLEEDM